ncbi:MAG: hypothetical protein MJ166_10100 [Clostridia bacterium]|nr:hypothetical protein [Clostridia bacterium]
MGFWDKEEDYMDEDERRLFKESQKRRKAEQAKCQADHSDDFGRYTPIHSTHDGCEADHRDDGMRDYTPAPSYSTASHEGCEADHDGELKGFGVGSAYGGSTGRVNQPGHVNQPNKSNQPTSASRSTATATIVVVAIIFCLVIAFGGISSAISDINRSVHESAKATKPPIVVINDGNVIHADVMIALYDSGNYSKEEMIDQYMTSSAGMLQLANQDNDSDKVRELAGSMIDKHIDSGEFDFNEHCYQRIFDINGYEKLTGAQITKRLLDYGFTEDEVAYAMDKYN